jgi:hypothetical protein
LFHLAEDAAMTSDPAIWPSLDFTQWRDTALTLQLWMQVVGKTRLALTPWLNHSWQVPFYVTARGLGTSLIPSTGKRSTWSSTSSNTGSSGAAAGVW